MHQIKKSFVRSTCLRAMSLLVTKGVVKPSQRQLFVKKIALQLFSRQIIIFPKSNCPPKKSPHSSIFLQWNQYTNLEVCPTLPNVLLFAPLISEQIICSKNPLSCFNGNISSSIFTTYFFDGFGKQRYCVLYPTTSGFLWLMLLSLLILQLSLLCGDHHHHHVGLGRQ